MRVSLDATLAFVVMVAMALLISLNPVRAAEPPKGTVETQQSSAPQEDQAAAAQQQQDSALNIIVIQADDERFIPNPFKNPLPRMISDGWAQRT